MACHDVWLAAFSQGTCDSAPLGTGRSEWVMHLFAGILPRHGEQTPCGRFKGHKKYKVNIKSFSSPFPKHVLLLILLVFLELGTSRYLPL
ncbi:hypothetical protein HDV64DRAFT_46877 [Trichoderma sp. TUCIM 5745]